MTSPRDPATNALFNRRAFLRGAAGVAVALPFIESLPERSAWAANAKPVFGFFICAVDGVVVPQFFPTATGPITPASLAAANAATSQLAGHAGNLSCSPESTGPRVPFAAMPTWTACARRTPPRCRCP